MRASGSKGFWATQHKCPSHSTHLPTVYSSGGKAHGRIRPKWGLAEIGQDESARERARTRDTRTRTPAHAHATRARAHSYACIQVSSWPFHEFCCHGPTVCVMTAHTLTKSPLLVIKWFSVIQCACRGCAGVRLCRCATVFTLPFFNPIAYHSKVSSNLAQTPSVARNPTIDYGCRPPRRQICHQVRDPDWR